MTKFLTLALCLMSAITIIYLVEVVEEFIEEDFAQFSLFLGAAISYILIGFWMSRTKSNLPNIIALVGTIGLILLYAVVLSDLSETVLGMDQKSVGILGGLSKILQISLVSILCIRIYKK